MNDSDRIRIGIICQCRKGYDYGWMYSYLCYSYDSGDSQRKYNSIRLFFIFKKQTDYVLTDGTLVAFESVDDENGYAENVTELNRLPFLNSETGIESDDKLIEDYNDKNLPYWEICYKSRNKNPDYYCIIYPIKNRLTNKYELAYNVLIDKEEEIFNLIYSIHKIGFKRMSLEEITQKIISIREYVNSFSLDDVLNTYECNESGYLQYRPGRDDHFFYSTSKTIDTDDEYIKNIIPLGVESDYCSCVGRDQDDYSRTNEYETEYGKKIAYSNYSKEKHYAFLISSFFEKYYTSKKEHEMLILKLKELKLDTYFMSHHFWYIEYTEENYQKYFKSLNTKALKEYKLHKP